MREKFKKLRAHHLLCLLCFRGGGYSKNYIVNFKKIMEKMREEPKTRFQIVDEVDVICNCCPYNKGGKCQKKKNWEKKVRVHDLRVLNKFNFQKGKMIEIGKTLRKIKKEIKPKDLPKICGSCQWLNFCSNLKRFNYV